MATGCHVPRRPSRLTAVTVLGLALGCSTPQPESPQLHAEQSSAPPAADAGKVTIEFRRAETVPEEGLTRERCPQTGQTIYLHPEADVTHADIAEAAAGLNDGRDEVLIRFTKEGAEKMARLHEAHRGKPVAILVNGKVVCAFLLADKITEWSAISGTFTREEVDRIVDRINAR
jgi:preprotein translocase subunit SecD